MAPSVAQSILDDNGGREPERLWGKFQLLRADPFVRPEEVKVRPASVPVLPAPLIVVEIVGRPRMRIAFVEILDRRRHVKAGSQLSLPAVECFRCQAQAFCHFPLGLAAVSFSST